MTTQISSQNFAESSVTVDRRYLPVLIIHTRGVTDIPAIEYFYEQRNEVLQAAAKAGDKIVLINALTEFAVPPATVRKRIGDLAKNDPQIPSIVAYVNVVPNAMLRGVMTAIQWIAGDGLRPLIHVATLEEGIRSALEQLQRVGVDTSTIETRLRDYSLPKQ